MPENPNVDIDEGLDFIDGPIRAMSNNNNSNGVTVTNNNNNHRKQQIPRIPSAGNQYYDIATQILGKAGSDLDELFIAAARDGMYDRLENFLQRRGEAIVSIDVKDKKTGNTPLIWAAKRGHSKIVQLLLRHGADITLHNYEGHTAVEVASPSIRGLLLESVERSTEATHHLLLQAAWQGDITVVRRLLTQSKVLDINCQNVDGFTPLMLATRDMHLFERISTQMSRPYSPVEVVSELLSARGDVHAMDGDGKTCLHHAAQSKALIAQSVVANILAGAPNLDFKDKRCFAPIHCACLTGNADCISTLLDGGSEVNSRGFAGATPLHITAYNNHEKATNVLLDHGANVTMTDDRGLTPLDFAKSRKMKKKLHEAWTEAINRRSTANLGPVRAPSREDLRSSVEDLTKRKKGEVIFDGMPSNPFSDGNKKEAISTITAGLRRNQSMRDLGSLRIEGMMEHWFRGLGAKSPPHSGAKGLTRHLSLKEKATRAEEQMNNDIENFNHGVRRLGTMRGNRATPLPHQKSRSTERLPAISPDRNGTDRNRESPVPFNRYSRSRRSFEDKKGMNRGRRVAPLSTREGTCLDDPFDRLTPGPPSPTPSVTRHTRSGSDPFGGTPNLADIAKSCDPYLQPTKRGRSHSVNSNTNDLLVETCRPTPVQRECSLMSVCSYRSESRLSTNNNNSPRLLNLGQMGLLTKNKTPVPNGPLYPNSNKVLPPTPTFITQKNFDKDQHSPISDDDIDVFNGVLDHPPELCRTRTIFRDEFILEESRPKDPFMQNSSGTDTVSSSSGSSHLSSPRDSPLSASSDLPKSAASTKSFGRANTTTSNSVRKILASMNISKQKLNDKTANGDKPVPNGNGNNNLSVPSAARGSSNIVNSNNRDTAVLRSVAIRNAAAAAASKNRSDTNTVNSASAKGSGAKSGGKITVHAEIDTNSTKTEVKSDEKTSPKSNNESVKHVEKSAPDIASSSGNNTTSGAVSANSQSVPVISETKVIPAAKQAPKSATASAKGISAKENRTVSQSKDNKTLTQSRRNVAQSPLQVVPTKLTSNIIRTAPKSSRDRIDEKTNSTGSKEKNTASNSSSNVKKDVTSTPVQEINVNKNQSRNATDKNSEPAIVIEDIGDASIPETIPVSLTVGVSKTVNKDTTNQSGKVVTKTQTQTGNKAVNQSPSVQMNNRHGAQSRNSNFTVSRSAGAVNKPGNPRKTLSGYMSRLQSSNNSTSAPSSRQPENVKSETRTGEPSVKATTTHSAQQQSSANQNGSQCTVSSASVKSTSPRDISVTPGVCRSASLSKSYNMASVPTVPKSANAHNSNSNISTSTSSASKLSTQTVNKTNITSTNTTSSTYTKTVTAKNSTVSKSTSDALVGLAKSSNTKLASKSISQMPSVGQVADTESTQVGKSHPGLSRSVSMSVIEETVTEKKLMSSSDTKIHAGAKSSTKPRPSSDGPVGATGINAVGSIKPGIKAPLVDICPESSPRVNKTKAEAKLPVNTPVIVNPFEELEQKREKEIQERLGARVVTASEYGFIVGAGENLNERSKTQMSLKSRNVKSTKRSTGKDVNKPSSGTSRGSSAKKRKPRNKDVKSDDTRPKSGKGNKRVRSGARRRKVPDNLAKQAEKADVALIGGIGWQLATSCLDKSEVDAVVVRQYDSSDSSSDTETEVSQMAYIGRLPSPLTIDTMQPLQLQIPNIAEISSAVSSPRFHEVKQTKEDKRRLPTMVNDGFPPMNLDMTQSSVKNITQSSVNNVNYDSPNRSGVIIPQSSLDIPTFLAQLREQERTDFRDVEDFIQDDDGNSDSDDLDSDPIPYSQKMQEVQRQIIMGKLTPIPESPHTNSSSLQLASRTLEAIRRFDANVEREELENLLGETPRNKRGNTTKGESSKSVDSIRNISLMNNLSKSVSLPKKNSSTKVSSNSDSIKPSQKSVEPVLLNSSISRVKDNTTLNKSVKTSQAGNVITVTANSHIRKPKPAPKPAPKPQIPLVSPKASAIVVETGSKHRTDGKAGVAKTENKLNHTPISETQNSVQPKSHPSIDSVTDVRNDPAKLDLKSLLAEKMNNTKKMLEESSQNSLRSRSGKERNRKSSDDTEKAMPTNHKHEIEINVCEDSSRTDDYMKSSRSSRRERRFSETKNGVPRRKENIDEVIDEILSNTFPSSRSTLKSRHSDSIKSASSTLTEVDKSVLKKMANNSEASPFHAKDVRGSSSYDETATLRKDNPDLLKRFHVDQFPIGQKVQAMIDAGADQSKVKAMIQADTSNLRAETEAKQLARIMNSFSQMELYAGPHGATSIVTKSSKKETPRKEGMSLSKIDFNSAMASSQRPPRPGSAGAGRLRPGKFTEIKKAGSSSHLDRSHSPSDVPKDLAAEIKRSPFVEIDTNCDNSIAGSEHFEELANVMRADSPNAESYHDRSDSACTSCSSHSAFEDTIQWKKGNVLGKGAFGTVWCGLTSEGQLIAVKQIELNTNNQNKAKREYEKVQEEVELLKTLEHKNIVGYMGTSLEESIVSIFMQFVPGGSIASILARFGALDEAVFRRYTRQIIEGVDYLHDNDIIHRDIKGGNVMLMPNGVIKLIDFGCAKRLCINLSMGQSEILKSMKGTPFWMAPEVVNETGHGKKSDIWSIGCTVFEMATRKPPWADMNPMAAIFAIGSATKPVPQLPDRFSEEAREFVNCCLSRDQTNRLSATDLQQTAFIRRRSKKMSTS